MAGVQVEKRQFVPSIDQGYNFCVRLVNNLGQVAREEQGIPSQICTIDWWI